MELVLVAVGTRMPAWVERAFGEYAKRMPREARLRLVEVKPARREGGSTATQALAAEAARIEAALPRRARRIVLDEHGTLLSSADLAQHLRAWQGLGQDVAFIVGGADGLAPALKAGADFVWSLSPLTLPHALVRVVVAEQLYRAVSILQGHPYHRE